MRRTRRAIAGIPQWQGTLARERGDYRYTPGQTPDAGQYQSGPPQLYQGAMPGTQVSQLTGQQVLDQDPGAAFRQSEARKALEGSAAAKGGSSVVRRSGRSSASRRTSPARSTATPSTA